MHNPTNLSDTLTPERAMTRIVAHRPLVGDMVWVPGGTFRMGSDRHYREEAPVREVTVAGFWIDRYPVTNANFAQFVKQSHYVTVAERTPDAADCPDTHPEMLQPGAVVFLKPGRRGQPGGEPVWLRYVPGANWRHPSGPRSTLTGLGAHPVVQVTYEDAAAYATWAGKELPTEAEWEYAARGGLDGQEFAWGSELSPGGRVMANVWQGTFPWENTLEDGFERTSPVGCFPPNGFGLYDMIGNVWEWTADGWTDHSRTAAWPLAAPWAEVAEPEDDRDSRQPRGAMRQKVLKGGSYLSAPNYSMRYRPAARVPQLVDTATCHLGFRCVVRPVPGS